MDPVCVALVQDSFRRVVPIAGTAAELFYDRLFAIEPELRPLFPADLSEQKRKLVQMLALVVNGLGRPETILPAVADLGRRHDRYGARPEHYGAVGAALLWTLEAGLGDAFTPATRSAWVEAYGLLSDVMIAAQREAAAA